MQIESIFSMPLLKNLPAGVKVDAIPERLGIEKIFEWEK